MLLENFAGDNFGVISFAVLSRKILVAENSVSIIGVIEVMPIPFLRYLHAVKITNKPTERDYISLHERVVLVGALYVIAHPCAAV